MKDSFKREIDYLRISVTDRCNLRCTYCMPAEGIKTISHEEILSMEEIARLVRILAGQGIRKIRLTGGEPLVRKNIEALIAQCRAVEDIEEISLTTNGILLPTMAADLKASGLDRVNISLDTLDPERYHQITRLGDLNLVLRGIEEAKSVGLTPIKINAVAIKGFNEGEILDFARLAIDKELHVRFIELMPVGEASEIKETHISMEEIIETLEKEFQLVEIPFGKHAGPSKDFEIEGTKGRVGVIAALSNHFCSRCNRMRLTADGRFRPCLYSSLEYDVREMLRNGSTDEDIASLYQAVIGLKPKEHHMLLDRYECSDRRMSQIGG